MIWCADDRFNSLNFCSIAVPPVLGMWTNIALSSKRHINDEDNRGQQYIVWREVVDRDDFNIGRKYAIQAEVRLKPPECLRLMA
eukprot:scaffold159077_cov38-Prasinocladus_malaysianus.AAC.1